MAGKTRKTEPRVTKRKVTMTSAVATGRVIDGRAEIVTHEATDYVRPDFLEAYVADARTRWQSVTVSDEPDAGPGGYEGETVIPSRLAHPDAGRTFPAESKG
jgi:hypothetical protein